MEAGGGGGAGAGGHAERQRRRRKVGELETLIEVKGVPVYFPFKPYDAQTVYMERLVEALQRGTGALLESPTGTGKTAALLCGALAWQQTATASVQAKRLSIAAKRPPRAPGGPIELAYDRRAIDGVSGSLDAAVGVPLDGVAATGIQLELPGGQKQTYEYARDEDEDAVDAGAAVSMASTSMVAAMGQVKPPTIVFASRTHSQLSQAVNELSRTRYRPRSLVMGSRHQLCVHPRVSAERGPGLNQKCRALTSQGKCKFKNNLDSHLAAEDPDGDMPSGRGEDGNIMDIEDLAAYGKRNSICPYYLTREQSLQGSAEIIFMPYNYLVDPSVRNGLHIVWENSIVIVDEAHNIESVAGSAASFDLSAADLAGCIDELDTAVDLVNSGAALATVSLDGEGNQSALHAEEALRLKTILLEMEEFIDSIELPKSGEGRTEPGMWIYEFFGRWNINFKTRRFVSDLIDKVNDVLLGQESSRGSPCLSKFGSALQMVLRDAKTFRETAEHYRVHIHIPEKPKNGRGGRSSSFLDASGGDKGRSISFWCFSPGVAMRELRELGVRCMILTSGTLSPMDSFAAELAMEFPVRLENSHVISPEQVQIMVIPKGPTGRRLLSTFDYRQTSEYKSELGHTIANFARVVPAGLLVFFASYAAMDSAMTAWQEDGTLSRFGKLKQVFVEPRTSADLGSMMVEYRKAIDEGKLCRPARGAIFFAVCRGKVSEGLDFANDYGRAVIVTGLPYAPSRDQYVILKRRVLDEQAAKNSRLGKSVPSLSGSMWYNQQASRAVNQAVGRVIRHANDFGAIILCDERFASDGQRSRLSLWLRPRIEVHGKFGMGAARLGQFFRANAGRIPKLKPPEPIPSPDDVDEDVGDSDRDVSEEAGVPPRWAATAGIPSARPQPPRKPQRRAKRNPPMSLLSALEASKATSPVAAAADSATNDAAVVPKSLSEQLMAAPTQQAREEQRAQKKREREERKRQKAKAAKLFIERAREREQTSQAAAAPASRPSDSSAKQAAKPFLQRVRSTVSAAEYVEFKEIVAGFKASNDGTPQEERYVKLLKRATKIFSKELGRQHLLKELLGFLPAVDTSALKKAIEEAKKRKRRRPAKESTAGEGNDGQAKKNRPEE